MGREFAGLITVVAHIYGSGGLLPSREQSDDKKLPEIRNVIVARAIGQPFRGKLDVKHPAESDEKMEETLFL